MTLTTLPEEGEVSPASPNTPSQPIPISVDITQSKNKPKLNGFTSVIANDEEYLFFKKQPLFQSFCAQFNPPRGERLTPNVSEMLQKYLVFYLHDWHEGPYMVAYGAPPTAMERHSCTNWKHKHPALSDSEFQFYLDQVVKVNSLCVDSWPALAEFCRLVQSHCCPKRVSPRRAGLLAALMDDASSCVPVLTTQEMLAYYLCIYMQTWQQYWGLCPGKAVLTTASVDAVNDFLERYPVICPAVLHQILLVLRSSSAPQ